MDVIESGQLLLLAVATTGIACLVSALVVVFRTRKIYEELSQLEALRHSLQGLERDMREIRREVGRIADVLPGLSGLGLHLRQIKRDQRQVSERLSAIPTARHTVEGLRQLRRDLEKRNKEINKIARASQGLQEWKSRVSMISSDARHLFESEPIRELIDGLGSPPNALTAEPPARLNDEGVLEAQQGLVPCAGTDVVAARSKPHPS
jgi:hypothetical protein